MLKFNSYTNVTDVVIPSKVRVINGDYLCANMQNLKSTTLDSIYVSYMASTYENCSNLILVVTILIMQYVDLM